MQGKFYILKPAVGTEETGHVFPAVESYEDYDFNSPNSVHKLNHHEFPNFIPDIRFKLAKGAKLCDVMGQSTISACGLLISERLKNLIESVKTIDCKFYPSEIHSKNVKYIYYWCHFIWDNGIENIDFNKSKFKISEFGEDIGDIEITDYKNLLDKQTELGFMKLIYNYQTHIKKNDFSIFIHPLNKSIYCTDIFKHKINSEKITGISLVATNKLSMG